MLKRRRIKNHYELEKAITYVDALVEDDIKLSQLFMINPLLAMQDAGLELSESMIEHVKTQLTELGLDEGDQELYERVKSGETAVPWVNKVTFVEE